MNKTIADRYMVVTSLGEGGMADVFLAVDTILNREVAVKVLRGELREDPVAQLRFLREASAISKLQHPNIVEVYDVGEYDDKNYIVMEYVRGRTLKQLIAQRGALQKEEAVEIMKQLVSAVHHAHENSIIHRDIKPQNILVKDDGTIKITDFGIALAHDAVQLTQADSILGSAHYIAPETTRGESTTIQVDIYALGIVFYELLTGSIPFSGDNPVQIAMKHLREDVPSVCAFNPTLPQSIENVIIKATAKNRLKRYPTTKDMLFDLDMCLLPEFSNVEKIDLDEDDEDSGTVILDRVKDIGDDDYDDENYYERNSKRNKSNQGNNKKKGKKKKENLGIKIFIVIMVLLMSAGVSVGVYYSGMIEGFSPTKLISVPDLEGLDQEKAKEALEEVGLKLNSEIETEMTDDVTSGLIIKQSPSKKKKVEEGSRIKITISKGKYFVIQNYEGKQLSEVEELLANTSIKILTDYEYSSEYTPGTILEQSILKSGDKVNPKVSKQIRFKVSAAIQFTLTDFTGMKIDSAKSVLEGYGAKVALSQMTTEGMSEEELKVIQRGVVIKQTPSAQSLYIQEGNNVVTLYYY